MAEERTVLQSMQEQHNFEITLAFKEFQDRWRGIFDQEQARWYQAGKEWRLAQEQDGHLSWEPYPKPFNEVVEDYHLALAEMRTTVSKLQHDNGPEHKQGIRY